MLNHMSVQMGIVICCKTRTNVNVRDVQYKDHQNDPVTWIPNNLKQQRVCSTLLLHHWHCKFINPEFAVPWLHKCNNTTVRIAKPHSRNKQLLHTKFFKSNTTRKKGRQKQGCHSTCAAQNSYYNGHDNLFIDIQIQATTVST